MSKLKTRFLSLGLAVVLVLTMIPMFSVFADDTASQKAVFITVSDQGKLAKNADGAYEAQVAVLVDDLDGDGKTTLDEAFVAFHKKECGGEGYALGVYGEVTEFFGIQTSNLFFFKNERLSSSVKDEVVEDGDYIVAAFITDDTYYSDVYSFFDPEKRRIEANVGEEIPVLVAGFAAMDTEGKVLDMKDIAINCINADSEEPAKVIATTSESGMARFTFDAPGFYILYTTGIVKDQPVPEWSGETGTVDAPIISNCMIVDIPGSEPQPSGDKADYTEVDKAIASIPEELKLAYSPESVEALTAAIETVVRDLPAADQARVDAMAAAINKAVAGLVRLPKGWHFGGKWWTYSDDYGYMQKGWIVDKGKWYYLTPSGIMHTGWFYENGVWFYLNPQSGAMTIGWVQVNNKWYFMHGSGAMAANEWIQGYWLSADGSWSYKPVGSWRRDNKGWWFGDTSGWYASGGGQRIDGVMYFFDDSGYFIH